MYIVVSFSIVISIGKLRDRAIPGKNLNQA